MQCAEAIQRRIVPLIAGTHGEGSRITDGEMLNQRQIAVRHLLHAQQMCRRKAHVILVSAFLMMLL